MTWTKFITIITDAITGKADVKTVVDAITARKDDILSVLADKTKTKTKIKDPNAPKKAKSSYIFFCDEYRAKIKGKNPDMSPTRITAVLGEMWRELPEEEKKKYNDLATKDKERYQEDISAYTPNESVSVPEKEKSKRGKSSYMYFCDEKRSYVKETYPDLKGKQITVKLGELWSALSDQEKKKYQDIAESNKPVENKPVENKVPEPKKKPVENKPVENKPVENKVPEPKKKPVEPKKKPVENKPVENKVPEPKKITEADRPAFESFCSITRDDVESDHPDWSEKKIIAELTKLWNNLSASEKNEYRDLPDEDSDGLELEDE